VVGEHDNLNSFFETVELNVAMRMWVLETSNRTHKQVHTADDLTLLRLRISQPTAFFEGILHDDLSNHIVLGPSCFTHCSFNRLHYLKDRNVELSPHEGGPDFIGKPWTKRFARWPAHISLGCHVGFALEGLNASARATKAILSVNAFSRHKKSLCFKPSPCFC